jgi:hypothetical protein
MSKARDLSAPRPKGKKPYRKPRLAVHGDIRDLTQSKGSNKSDGSGKPATKASGGPA